MPARATGPSRPSGPSSAAKDSRGKDNPGFHTGVAGRAEGSGWVGKGAGGAGAEAARWAQGAWQGVL